MRTHMRRVLASAATLVVATGLLAACGGGDDDDEQIAKSTAAARDIDPEVVADAQAEGKVVVYGNPPEDMWKRLIPTFEKVYPGITIETVDISGAELVQRVRSEAKTGAAGADLIIDSNSKTFLDMANAVHDRSSVYADQLPEFTHPAAGVYAFAADPGIILYNKAVIDENDYPSSLADLADLADSAKSRLTTYDLSNDNGYSQMWTLADALGDEAWDAYDRLFPSTTFEASGGTMVQKISQGEYLAGYFQSGLARGLLEPMGVDKLVGWSYAADGTPVQPRYAAPLKGSAHPNAAALLQDYLLSPEGQTVVCASGLTAVREDVVDTCGDFALKHIEDELGEENIHLVRFDAKVYSDRDAFESRVISTAKG